jgi:hypothetical protein
MFINAAEIVRQNVERIFQLDRLFFDLPLLNLRVALVLCCNAIFMNRGILGALTFNRR